MDIWGTQPRFTLIPVRRPRRDRISSVGLLVSLQLARVFRVDSTVCRKVAACTRVTSCTMYSTVLGTRYSVMNHMFAVVEDVS